MIVLEREKKMSSRMIDETGNRYGRWTVLEYFGFNKHHSAVWRCICECGNEGIVSRTYLKNGDSKSCGCLRKELISQRSLIDETGNRYCRWTVIESAGRNHAGVALWKCLCNCGTKKIVSGTNLRSGDSKSCGCLHKEKIQLPKGEAAFNSLFLHLKAAAKSRNHVFNLTKTQVRNIVTQKCHYCGSTPNQIIGYFDKNCVPCCKTCNFMKRAMSVEQLKSQITKIYKHFIEAANE